MEVKVPTGKYVLAVSGGVDSLVLLDLLSNFPGVELVIAHFNHGIREDSHLDEQLTAAAAQRYGWPAEVGHGKLGAGASEETARAARYGFLESAQAKHHAVAIITAHHQDDLIETALINLLRGSGRRGLVAISNNKNVLRPLLGYSKTEIISYAKKNNLKWREDSTNVDTDYLRNYVRQNIVAKMDPGQRDKLLLNLEQVSKGGRKIDAGLAELAAKVRNRNIIDRSKFNLLPVELGNELLIYWLRQAGLRDFDRPAINRLNVALRTAKGGSTHVVKNDFTVKIGPKTAQFERLPLR